MGRPKKITKKQEAIIKAKLVKIENGYSVILEVIDQQEDYVEKIYSFSSYQDAIELLSSLSNTSWKSVR